MTIVKEREADFCFKIIDFEMKVDYLISVITDVQPSKSCFLFVKGGISDEHAFDWLLV
jgi:hypothetical protein